MLKKYKKILSNNFLLFDKASVSRAMLQQNGILKTKNNVVMRFLLV